MQKATEKTIVQHPPRKGKLLKKIQFHIKENKTLRIYNSDSNNISK